MEVVLVLFTLQKLNEQVEVVQHILTPRDDGINIPLRLFQLMGCADFEQLRKQPFNFGILFAQRPAVDMCSPPGSLRCSS